MLNIFLTRNSLIMQQRGKNFGSIKDVKFVNFMSSWYFYVKIWWSKVKVIKGYNVCNVSINCRYILDNEDNSPWLENSLWHRQYYIAGALSEVWPGLQSLCARVVMVLSRSYLTNQWEQVHSDVQRDYRQHLYLQCCRLRLSHNQNVSLFF